MIKIAYLFIFYFCSYFYILSAQNCIKYTTIDNSKLELNSESFDGNITNHIYENEQGSISFDRNITSIGDDVFSESDINTYYDPQNDDEITIIGNSPYPDSREKHSLESIILPEGLNSIGNGIFKNCIYLKNITLPNSLSFIGEKAFANDTLLKTISRPFPNQPVLNYTFSDCRSLKTIDLSNITDSIGHRAFQRCLSLKSVSIPEGITTIADSAFYYCGASSISLPSTLKSIGRYAFCGMPITDINIPENLEELSFFCFGFTQLKHITIPPTIKKVNVSCFECCKSLESIDIPTSIPEIASNMFANCPSLTTINYSGTMEQWNNLPKGKWWYNGSWLDTPLSVIHCTDGDIQIQPHLLSQQATRQSLFLHIDDCKWATCCLPFSLFGTPSGLQIYKVKNVNSQNSILNLQKTTGVAHKPYLVYGEPGYYIMSGKWYDTPLPTELTNGMLMGTYEDLILNSSSSFVLQNINGRAAFYQVNEELPIILPAYKAFLNYPDAQYSSYRLTDEDNTEELNSLQKEKKILTIYNLEGIKINDIQKGINIIEYEDNTKETILKFK